MCIDGNPQPVSRNLRPLTDVRDDDGAFSLSLKNQRIGKRCYIVCTVLFEVDQVAWIWARRYGR
ncbi:unnamed protein product [Ectocarpus sp. 12 AP-2014]